MKITTEEMIAALKAKREALLKRRLILSSRAHKLTEASYCYDDETIASQTPEESAKLDRLIRLSNRAQTAYDEMDCRANHLEMAIGSIESEERMSLPRERTPR